ncbi:MAG: UPF0758 domain-containing protein [Pseudonocardiaceae bacterium]
MNQFAVLVDIFRQVTKLTSAQYEAIRRWFWLTASGEYFKGWNARQMADDRDAVRAFAEGVAEIEVSTGLPRDVLWRRSQFRTTTENRSTGTRPTEMRVKDLPVGDRPRERLLERGSEALADRELLALLLGSGARGLDAVELAGQLIANQGGLRRLAQAAPHELVGLLGVGPAKAARVAAGFELARRALADEQPAPRRIVTTADIAACAAPLLRGLRHERVVVVVCDKAGTVLLYAPPDRGWHGTAT